METYTHKPIDLSKKAIRLLRLCGADREDAITCELFQSFLEEDQDVHVEYEALSYTWSDTVDEDHSPYKALSYTWSDTVDKDYRRYEALSYTWSDTVDEEHRPDEAPGPKFISIEGLPFQVTNNLFLALKHLRLPDSDRILWVDAICINQDDGENKEKNHQVRQMNVVYSSAENVIIWLGLGSRHIGHLFDASAKLHRYAVCRHPVKGQTPFVRCYVALRNLGWLSKGNATPATGNIYSALTTVLRRPWFRRVWVIQEVALAKRATVVCGWSSTPTSSFALMPHLLRVKVPELTQAVLDVMPGPLRNEESSWWRKKRDLLTMLQKFGSAASSRAHDRIYALLGVSSDPDAIEPKYQATEQEAVGDVLKFVVSKRGTIPKHIKFPEWSVDQLITRLHPGEHMEEYLSQTMLLWGLQNREIDLADHLLEIQSRFPILGPSEHVLHLLAKTPGSQSLVKAFARRNNMYLDFNYCCWYQGGTALQCALRNDNLEVADALLEAQDFALDQLKTHSAQGYHDSDSVSAIIPRVSPRSSRSTKFPPRSASAEGPAFKRLWRDDMMYLETAARQGRTSDLEFILSRMPSVSPPSAKVLCLVIKSGSKSAVELLIQHGADIDGVADAGAGICTEFLQTPLEVALEARNTQMAAFILEYQDSKKPVMSTRGAVEDGTSDGKEASVAEMPTESRRTITISWR